MSDVQCACGSGPASECEKHLCKCGVYTVSQDGERLCCVKKERDRLRDALEAEAVEQARRDLYTLDYYSAADTVGREVDIGGIKFRIGCDEHANLCASEVK